MHIIKHHLQLAYQQVKADKDSHSMGGLKSASNAVRKATEELVKAAQATPKKTPYVRVKKDIFKEVFFIQFENCI